MLPIMIQVATELEEYQFVVAAVDNLPRDLYPADKDLPQNVELHFGKTYDILSISRAAIVTSGTATLETALLGVPQVMGYVTHPLTYLVGRPLVKIDVFSLVNLIAGRELIKELIQRKFNASNIIREVNLLIQDDGRRQEVLEGYRELKTILGDRNASKEAAKRMWG